MAARAPRRTVRPRRTDARASGSAPGGGSATSRGGEAGSDLRVRLQILAAVFLPGALVLAWLNSRGFFQAP